MRRVLPPTRPAAAAYPRLFRFYPFISDILRLTDYGARPASSCDRPWRARIKAALIPRSTSLTAPAGSQTVRTVSCTPCCDRVISPPWWNMRSPPVSVRLGNSPWQAWWHLLPTSLTGWLPPRRVPGPPIGTEPQESAQAAECDGVGKAMLLITARTAFTLPTAAALAWDSTVGSLWWVAYFWLGYGGLANQASLGRLQAHMGANGMPATLALDGTSQLAVESALNAYYMCTYILAEREAAVRALINHWAAGPTGPVGALRREHPGIVEAAGTLAMCDGCSVGEGGRPRLLVIDAFWVHSYSSHRSGALLHRYLDLPLLCIGVC